MKTRARTIILTLLVGLVSAGLGWVVWFVVDVIHVLQRMS